MIAVNPKHTMKYYIIGGVILLALIVGAMLVTPNTPSGATRVAPVSSALTVAEPSYDFGTIDIFGGKVSTEYTIANTGTEDVQILSAQTSCMCTTGVIDDLTFGMHESNGTVVTIPAGTEKTLTAIYDPLAHGPNGTGLITRELTLTTNSSVTPSVRVKFNANVIKNES